MDLALSPADEAFRAEVRRFLDEKLTPDLREAGKKTGGVLTDPPATAKWHKALYEKGWLAPAWPKEYGGPGWSEMQRYIFSSECASANAPILANFGTRMCGPVLMKFGSPEQKAFYLPRILKGDDYWCQGYSEPGSGSDLASLQMKALREGDHPASSLLKSRGTEMSQRITELSIEALAFYIAPFEPEARLQGANVKPVTPDHGLVFMPQYLNSRGATIYGGSSEVQRNIMSKLILGV